MLPQIVLDRAAGVPLHHQLGDALRRLILAGELRAGARLPATRRAASALRVSRNVVVLAYEQLQLEGYLSSAVGVGTWVPRSLEAGLLRPVAGSARGPAAVGSRRDAGVGGEATPVGVAPATLSRRGDRIVGQASWLGSSRPTLPFRPSGVAADLFPARTWSRLASRVWRTGWREVVPYGDVEGYGPLREAIAEHVARHRGVRCDAGAVLVTGGSKPALDLIGRLLVDPGDRVVVEDPGYYGATASLAAAGAVLVPVPVDDQGLDPGGATESMADARLLYTTPSHQYPLGVTLSLERRLAVLEHAGRTGGWVVEDDYDSEFRYEARPLPALQGLDGGGRVIYVGTFSKVLSPGLRMGFLVLPAPLVEPFTRARAVTDNHPPLSVQATLAAFMAEGHLERHIARMRQVYGERRAALRHALERELGAGCRIVPGDAGLHLTLLLDDGVDDAAVSRLARARGLDVQPLSAHYLRKPGRPGLLLGYGAFPPERLAGEVRVLVRCIAGARQPAEGFRAAPRRRDEPPHGVPR